MITILTALAISTTPSVTSPESGFAGDTVATWVHDDATGRTSINLDGDGRCMIDGLSKSGAHYQSSCGYWIRGRSVFLRLRPMHGPRPELEATYDPESDELHFGAEPSDVFTRRPLDERTE